MVGVAHVARPRGAPGGCAKHVHRSVDVAGLAEHARFDMHLRHVPLLLLSALSETKAGRELLAPTIRNVINDFIASNPETPSYLELNPLLRFDSDGAA